MEKVIKIKQKGELKKLLKNEGYDVIIFWSDGTWQPVSTGYGGEISGDQPVTRIIRVYHYDLTTRQINELVREIEQTINNRI